MALPVRRRSSRTGPSLLAKGAEVREFRAPKSVEAGRLWLTDAGQVALGSAEPVEVTRASRVGHLPERLEAKLGVRTPADAVARALRESA